MSYLINHIDKMGILISLLKKTLFNYFTLNLKFKNEILKNSNQSTKVS